jgi:hypothetical protein
MNCLRTQAWIELEPLSMRHNFYFGKRQWLADARTVIAAVRYLYQSSSANPSNSVNVVKSPVLPITRNEASTNLMVTTETESTDLIGFKSLSENAAALCM